jgi:hypothetical protein
MEKERIKGPDLRLLVARGEAAGHMRRCSPARRSGGRMGREATGWLDGRGEQSRR